MSHDTWAHRLVAVAVPPLARLGVTPNQVTWARLASGLAAAGALASGAPAWMHAGAGLWLASMLLDRADGALARLTGQTSAWGHKLDLASDFIATSLLFVGLGLGAQADGAVLMGIAAGLSVGLIFLVVQRIEALLPADASAIPSAGGIDADDALFAVAPVIWLGWAEPFLVVAAVGAPLALLIALAAWWRLARR